VERDGSFGGLERGTGRDGAVVVGAVGPVEGFNDFFDVFGDMLSARLRLDGKVIRTQQT
jgi:hypothetical protein